MFFTWKNGSFRINRPDGAEWLRLSEIRKYQSRSINEEHRAAQPFNSTCLFYFCNIKVQSRAASLPVRLIWSSSGSLEQFKLLRLLENENMVQYFKLKTSDHQLSKILFHWNIYTYISLCIYIYIFILVKTLANTLAEKRFATFLRETSQCVFVMSRSVNTLSPLPPFRIPSTEFNHNPALKVEQGRELAISAEERGWLEALQAADVQFWN